MAIALALGQLLALPGSNTVNPITVGEDAASSALPWLYGDSIAPSGEYDKICYNTFKFGGFAAKFGQMSAFRKACKTDSSLQDEFLAARTLYLELVNSGKTSMRLRGAKKADVLARLTEARATVVRLYKSQKSQAKVPYTIMTLQRYSDIEGNTTPEKDGVPTSMRMFEGVDQGHAEGRRQAGAHRRGGCGVLGELG